MLRLQTSTLRLIPLTLRLARLAQYPCRNITTMYTSTPTVTLSSTSAKMPLVGMGLWKVPNPVCADSVYAAIRAGYRLFDGASDYGNEVECGQGIARAIKEGLVKREELFITSKLWNSFHAEEHVLPACERSLKDWGLDYFDLYLIHFPIALKYGESGLFLNLTTTSLMELI